MDYKQFPAFQHLDPQQLQSFVNACQKGTISPGKRIVKQNAQGNQLFFVFEGQVRVYIETLAGEKELSQIAAPTVLGEISFFSGEPNSANVATVTQISALIMPFSEMRHRLHQGDAAASIILLNLAEAIAQRAASMTRKLSELYGYLQDAQLSEIQDYSKNLFGEWSFL